MSGEVSLYINVKSMSVRNERDQEVTEGLQIRGRGRTGEKGLLGLLTPSMGYGRHHPLHQTQQSSVGLLHMPQQPLLSLLCPLIHSSQMLQDVLLDASVFLGWRT